MNTKDFLVGLAVVVITTIVSYVVGYILKGEAK